MSNYLKTTPLPYYFKGKLLQPFRKNDYTKEEKLEIVIKLNQEYAAGMLPVSKLIWIYENDCFGKYTVQLIIDDMLEKGIIKLNPITLDKRRFRLKKGFFDW